MRSPICFLVCLVLLGSFACKNSQDHELELQEKEEALQQKELELKEREDKLNESSSEADESERYSTPETVPQTVTKYMYVLITTNEPELHQTVEEAERPISSGYFDEPRELPKYKSYTTPKFYDYTSDIIEVSDYNEDKRYMQIERFEKQINSKLVSVNWDLRANASTFEADVSGVSSASIISRKSFVFDSYKEASEHKSGR